MNKIINSKTRRRFTEAELETARETDLSDPLTSLGYQVRRVGSDYTTKEMDSLRIKDRRTWRRYSENVGGDAVYVFKAPIDLMSYLTLHREVRNNAVALCGLHDWGGTGRTTTALGVLLSY